MLLHYHDLGPNLTSQLKFIKLVSAGKIKDFSLKNFQFEKEIDKDGTITDNKCQSIYLSTSCKEPISTKGPRISCFLCRKIVLVVLSHFNRRQKKETT
jgi:ribonuclease G